MSKPILHRAPDALLDRVNAWALTHGEVNRTVAINLLIANALDADEAAEMRAEIQGLREMVVKLATTHAERPKGIEGPYSFPPPPFVPRDPEFAPATSFRGLGPSALNVTRHYTACIGCGVYENARDAVENSVAPMSNADIPLIAKTARNDYKKDI